MIAPHDITLGLLAGGMGSRLGGVDKGWLQRSGVPQVLRLAKRLSGETAAVLVSANRDPTRYADAGLVAIPDRHADIGPIAGLDALAAACRTPWLLTVPVDLVDVNDCLLRSLAAAGGEGAFAIDDDGAQPLVALWRVETLREALSQSLAANEIAIHALQARIGMTGVRFGGFRFGNLNTPADLAAAGIEPPSAR
ncbi:MAG TPA: NTP transferase domain-containing protein [Lysobacter sp.]|nr:NTP transferase domain-containing protein [Lysobacter sp.]